MTHQNVSAPLHIVVGSPPRTLDPPNATDNAAQEIIRQVYEGLVSRNQQGKITPCLAQSWEISNGGLEYIFYLKKGITFHDGTLLDAEVVAANLRRFCAEPSRRSHLLKPILEKVTVIDSATVQMHLRKPFAPFLAILGSGALSMVSALALAEHRARFPIETDEFDDTIQSKRDRSGLGCRPVGTGPFKLVEWATTDQMILLRHPDYWGPLPGIEEIHLECQPDGNVRYTRLIEGATDAAVRLSLDKIEQLKHKPEFTTLKVSSDNWLFIGINNLHPPFNDVRVRRALNLAVDKQAIIASLLRGAGRPVDSCISQSSFGYAPTYAYPYDPDQARQLLKEVGLSDGFSTELATPRGAYPMDYETALVVAEYLAKVGVEVNVVPYDDWGEYLTYVRQPPERATHQMFLLIRGEGDTGDAHFTLFTKFHSHGWRHSNNQFYRNPEVDRLSEFGAFSLNAEQRQQTYAKAQELIMRDAPMIFLHTVTETLAYNSRVTGLKLYPSGIYDLRQARINKKGAAYVVND